MLTANPLVKVFSPMKFNSIRIKLAPYVKNDSYYLVYVHVNNYTPCHKKWSQIDCQGLMHLG